MPNAQDSSSPTGSDGSRRSSFFSIARRSFIRSNGDRGANVEALRGTHGADFEGTAKIMRGGARGGLFCCGGNDKKEKFVLIKGPFCFVFSRETSSSPLYAINLVDLKTEHKGLVALMQTNLGDTDYELHFEKEEVAKRFCRKADAAAKTGKAEEIRKVSFLFLFPGGFFRDSNDVSCTDFCAFIVTSFFFAATRPRAPSEAYKVNHVCRIYCTKENG
jgi:hypothetical protein